MPARNDENGALPAFIGALTASLALCLGTGCAAPVAELSAEIPKAATPAVVEAGLDTLEDPNTRLRMARLLATPEMRAIQRELAAGLLDAALATLGEEERIARIDALTSRAVARMLRGAAREVPPLAASVTRGAVDGALDAALDPARSKALQRSVSDVVATTVRSAARGIDDAGIAKSVSSAMTEQIGPALEATLRDDVTPGLAATLGDERLHRALGATAHVLGREMVLGVTEALAQQKPPPASGSLLSRLTNVAQEGARLFGSAAWVLVALVVLLFAWIVKLLVQTRRYRADASRRIATAQLLEEAARATEGKPWSGELIGALQERVRAEEKALTELRAAKRWRSRQPPRERHA